MFIGVDCGTQGTKALVIDDNGRVCGRGHAAHSLIERDSGAREQHPSIWIDAMIAAVRMAASRDEGDRFEREQRDFFARVRAAYLERAATAASRFVVLDATEAPERLQARIHEALATRLAA